MTPATLAAQAPTPAHILASASVEPHLDSPKLPAVAPTGAASVVISKTSVAASSTDAGPVTTAETTVKGEDQPDVPLWARTYHVSQPPFEVSSRGHPLDVVPKTATQESPESNASPEEVERRQNEVAELDARNATAKALDEEHNSGYTRNWALPWHDQRFHSKWYKQDHIAPYQHEDPALRALRHEDPEGFLHKNGIEVESLSPRFGSAVRGPGIDLTRLTPGELDELALFVTQRGVVTFEGQEAFINSSPEKLVEFGKHFSPVLHQHPVASEVKGYPELLPIYRSDTLNFAKAAFKHTHGLNGWHTDITFEAQPPGITTLLLFDPPESGGDTGYVDTEELYRRLSPYLRKVLTGLSAEHDFFKNPALVRSFASRPQKRTPVSHVHPVIRTHPVTGRQSLFVNENFVTRLVGLKEEESKAIIGLLTDLSAKAHDAQVRVRWRPGSVTLWDNRRTQHRIIHDVVVGRRHGVRITPQAERPFYARTAYDDDLEKEEQE